MSPAALQWLRAAKWRSLQASMRQTPALAEHAGSKLAAFPITEISEMRADYGRWNSLGLTHAQCTALADAAERGEDTGKIVAGWSTGSGGGARGLFLTDAAERADYIGQSLARLLPARALLRRQRIALHLRTDSALYADVRRRRIAFAHFPLGAAATATGEALTRFNPTILIAPPHRLLGLAEQRCTLPSLAHLFYGSEPMSDAERAFVAERMGLRPQPIYQATEGFLGGACRAGRLHLNDYALDIELEPVAGTGGFRPVITDLHRHSQPIVRVRSDDFLELDERGRCPCGFAGRTILPIMGRVRDLWHLPDRTLTPREVVETVEGALGEALRWQASASQQEIIFRTAPDCRTEILKAAAHRLHQLTALPVRSVYDLPEWKGTKRRKVVWHDG